jgi:transposase-like protein
LVDTSFCPASGYMQIVEKRDKTTLLRIIRDHVHIGSTIYSDEYKAYDSLNQEGYNHFTVCHKFNFVNPENNGIIRQTSPGKFSDVIIYIKKFLNCCYFSRGEKKNKKIFCNF